MSIKTLHITNAWHSASGGIATFYRALLEAACAQGRRLVLVVPAEADRQEELAEGVRLYGVRAGSAPLNHEYRWLSPASYLFPWGRLGRILEREQPDLVEICDKYSFPALGGLLRQGWLAGGGRRPTVVGLSCERMDDSVSAYLTASPVARRLAHVYMKWLYFPMCDHHLAVSPYTAGELEIASKGHCRRRGVWICPMGVDCTRFRPARRSPDARARLLAQAGCPQDGHLLLYAGRLAPEKNLSLLLELMEHLPGGNHRMIVAGDGALREAFARETDDRAPGLFHFTGHVADREELADLYANCDLFVHPNPREPFGIAPLEAMASGLPLLAPECGGLTAYADHGNAWLTRPDAKAFAAAAQRILGGGGERETKLARARRTAEAFAWPAVAARYLSLYEELHRLTEAASTEPRTAPNFYSTPGDRLGREIRIGVAETRQ